MHVIGVDAGGTSTRALTLGADGKVLGKGHSGGGNPNSHPPELAAEHLAEAVTAAVRELSPSDTRACVLGMAGTSKLADPGVADAFDAAWARAGISAPVRVVSDAEVAFASATPAADGTVLIAGTGSIAARIRGHRMVAMSGGYGWLLGDEGSAYWIGREAVRSTLDALTLGDDLGALASGVLEKAGCRFLPDDRITTARELIAAANRAQPIDLATFAPLVSDAEAAGDPAAAAISRQAAALLVRTALAAREPGERSPVVLVGGVLDAGGPVGAAVREGLAELEVLTSADGVLGAAWLAALEAFGAKATRPA